MSFSPSASPVTYAPTSIYGSLAYVTYMDEGEICGITLTASNYTHHRVCRTGFACFILDNADGSSASVCQNMVKDDGESCIPSNFQCGSTSTCLLNAWNEYTCGGIKLWDGHGSIIDTTVLATFGFESNYTMIILGIIFMLAWLTSALWFYTAKTTKVDQKKALFKEPLKNEEIKNLKIIF